MENTNTRNEHDQALAAMDAQLSQEANPLDSPEMQSALEANRARLDAAIGEAATAGVIDTQVKPISPFEDPTKEWKVTQLPAAGKSQQRPFDGRRGTGRVAHMSGVVNHSLAGVHTREVTGYKHESTEDN